MTIKDNIRSYSEIELKIKRRCRTFRDPIDFHTVINI